MLRPGRQAIAGDDRPRAHSRTRRSRGLVANVVFAVVLVPRLGVTGGAIAFAATLVLWNTALVAIARRLLGVHVTAFGALSLQELDGLAHKSVGEGSPQPSCESVPRKSGTTSLDHHSGPTPKHSDASDEGDLTRSENGRLLLPGAPWSHPTLHRLRLVTFFNAAFTARGEGIPQLHRVPAPQARAAAHRAHGARCKAHLPLCATPSRASCPTSDNLASGRKPALVYLVKHYTILLDPCSPYICPELLRDPQLTRYLPGFPQRKEHVCGGSR